MRHIGGFLKSRRDERPQTGAQASGYDATTKEAPTERQRHRLFLSPFQGFVLLMSQSRGLTPPSVVCRTFGASPPNCNKYDELLAGLQIPLSDASGLQIRSNGRGQKPSPQASQTETPPLTPPLRGEGKGSLAAVPIPSKGRGKEAWPRFPSPRRGGVRKLGRGSPPLEGEGLGVGTVLLALHLHGASCRLSIPFWRICNPTGQSISICNAI